MSVTGTLATTLGTLNPFRYRGYVFDEETGLYYLRSRYYCPICCRFINKDSAIGNSRALNDHNLFAYCINNPVNMEDDNGEESVSIGNGVPQFDAICTVVAVIITALGQQVEAILQERSKIDRFGIVGDPVVLSQRITAEDLPRYLNPLIKPQIKGRHIR